MGDAIKFFALTLAIGIFSIIFLNIVLIPQLFTTHETVIGKVSDVQYGYRVHNIRTTLILFENGSYLDVDGVVYPIQINHTYTFKITKLFELITVDAFFEGRGG